MLAAAQTTGPDTSKAHRERFYKKLFSTMPTQGLHITVRVDSRSSRKQVIRAIFSKEGTELLSTLKFLLRLKFTARDYYPEALIEIVGASSELIQAAELTRLHNRFMFRKNT